MGATFSPRTVLVLLAVFWTAAGRPAPADDVTRPAPFESALHHRLDAPETDPHLQQVLKRIENLEQENAELQAGLQYLLDERQIPNFAEHAADEGCSVFGANGTSESDAAWRSVVVDQTTNLARRVDWSGFIQLDSGWFSQDSANKQAVGDITDTTGIRRLRLRASGQVLPDTSFVVDLDFAASGHPSFRDVKFTLHEQELVQNIQIGYFAQPFGLEAMTSGRDLLLLERQLPFALVPFRQTALGAYGTSDDQMVQWSVSGYRFPTDSFGVSQGESGGWGLATRATAIPVYDGDAGLLVHFGGSYSFVSPGTNEVRYAIEPGFFVTDSATRPLGSNVPVFVDTGNIPTHGVNLAGLEFASQFGPLNMQAEVIGAFVNQVGGPHLAFPGASAKLAYVLTGEVHPYIPSTGTFDRIKPREPSRLLNVFGGAWESVVGLSYLDLNDANIDGGRMQSIVVGLNRYVNDHVKVQVNVIRGLLNDRDTGSSAATVAAFRIQAEF